jgi:hypothetical protein
VVGFGPEIGFLLDEKALHEVSPTLLRLGAGGQGETIHGRTEADRQSIS